MIPIPLDLGLVVEEGIDLECKRAGGKNGKGTLPRSFWETLSAMANTVGGLILLGVGQKGKDFEVTGIADPGAILKSIWDGINNPQKFSAMILRPDNVQVRSVGSTRVVSVQVPRVSRGQRPVHVGPNPMTGTYRRRHEGDYLCDPETVRRMIAERIEDIRDDRLLGGFDMSDLNTTTLQRYRNRMSSTTPDHPFLGKSDQEFLRSIGGWKKDHTTGEEGLSLAGLLMFGQLRAIHEAVPHYTVDYQERPRARSEARWVDRLTTDGTWSGNLYDFYTLTIPRLTREVKIPFRLEGDERKDDSPVHEALREALVNTLIHADYTGRTSVLIVKRPDLVGFRNPGTMRVAVEDAIEGGHSDCRNRTLQKMFKLVGLGEQAGSGVPKIYRNWTEQWRRPVLLEDVEKEQTLLTLYLVSLLPDGILHDLDARIGPEFRRMSTLERLALATVAIEGQVTHPRLKEMTFEHPHDISVTLAGLVKDGHLDAEGVSRGKFYFFPGEPPTDTVSREYLAGSPEHLPGNPEYFEALKQRVAHIRKSGRAPVDEVKAAVVDLCKDHFLSVKQIADLLNRSEETIRHNYLAELLREGRLVPKFPQVPSHPRQAYRAAAANGKPGGQKAGE